MPAHTRRLLLLLAALTALVLTSVSSALAASGAQNRVWAFNEPGQVDAGLISLESSCTHQGSIGSGAELASGFCVATEGGGAGESSIHRTLGGGERGIEPSEVTQNGDPYFDSQSGNKV